MKQYFRALLWSGILILGLVSTGTNAEPVTLSDYLVNGNPGDSWTYIYTFGPQTGTEFTETEPFFSSIYPLFPAVAETDQLIPFEPGINNIYQIIDSLTVQADTFSDVLVVVGLDENFPRNFVNDDFGIDPAINQGVTDVIWFAAGVGLLKFMDVEAEVPRIGEMFELRNFLVIGDAVIVNKNVVLGDNVSVGDSTTINKEVVIGDNVNIGNNVFIAKEVTIEDGVTIGEASIVNKGAYLCSGATIGASVTIGKNRLVDTNANIIDSSILPGSNTPPGSCTMP